MSAKRILLHDAARAALHEGITVVARAVGTTLGPKGRNVALGRSWGIPEISPDGVTVAREITLADPCANLGAQLLIQAASKTGDVAGDGTTTSTLIAYALVEGGLKLVAAGASPLLLKRGLDRAVHELVGMLPSQAIPVAGHVEMAQVATISALDPAIGELLATIIDRLGRDAVITVEEGQGTAITYELVEGMQFERGYISPYFVTDATKLVVELEDPAILITNQAISAAADLLTVLQTVIDSGKRELLIIADDITGDALATLVVNKLRGTLEPLAVKAPGFGDRRAALLQDIAIMTGGVVIAEELGRRLDSVQLTDLGRARRVHADKDNTIIVEGHGDHAAIQARVEQIKAQAAAATLPYDREMLQERAARLSGGVAVIHVGAATETALKERKARLDDALHATRAALEEGIVPGGGVAYLNLAPALDELAVTFVEERMALDLLRTALDEPARRIAANAGIDGAVVVDQIKQRQVGAQNQNIGYDAMRDEYGDLLKWGVIDPAKVVRVALENAVSVAGMILSTDALITEEPVEEATSAPLAEPMYG